MSIINIIKPKKPLDIVHLHSKLLAINNLEFENRGENIIYYWILNKSTKGVDISILDNEIEIRNTVLSSNADYKLTHNIINIIMDLTEGKLFNEDNELIEKSDLFTPKWTEEEQKKDSQILLNILSLKDDISIYGPIRKIHFGQNTCQKYKPMLTDPSLLVSELLALILKTQYKLPKFEYGDILAMEDGDKEIITKLITNNVDLIIDKYDYVAFETKGNNLLFITNQSLNKILPAGWDLIDEYTIVAPIIPKPEFDILIANAKKYDCSDELMNEKEPKIDKSEGLISSFIKSLKSVFNKKNNK